MLIFYQLILVFVFFILLIAVKLKVQLPRYFITLCIIVFSFEFVINDLSSIIFGSNILSVNLYTILSVVLYHMIMICSFNKFNTKKVRKILIIYYLSLFFDVINNQFATELLSTSYIIGISISVVLFIYFLKEIIFDLESEPIYTHPMFYFGIGITLFLCSSFPLLFFADYFIVSIEANSSFVSLIQLGNNFLAIGYLFTILASWRLKHIK